jgi:cell division protein FtsN
MLGVLLLVTLSFFFLFGLIIGRGMIPPPKPAELEHLLPSEPAHTAEAPERILPAEDLRFLTSLRSDSNTPPPPPSRPVTPASPQPSVNVGQTIPAVVQPDAPQIQPDSALYDYVVRVAAFKSEDQADALRAKLEGAGMRTRLIKEPAQAGTWFYVQILYRGTPDNLQALRDSLPRFGVRDSLIASKTPVTP